MVVMMETIFSPDVVFKFLVISAVYAFALLLLLVMSYKMGKAEKLREPETV